MPALGFVRIPGRRWLPPVPLPLFLLWPLVPVCFGIARLLERRRPQDAAKLRLVTHAFCEMRGLSVDIDTSDREHVRARFF